MYRCQYRLSWSLNSKPQSQMKTWLVYGCYIAPAAYHARPGSPSSPGGQPASLQFQLATLLALLSALPARVQRCAVVLEPTWQRLTPALVRLLGSPTTERVSSHEQAGAERAGGGGERGRGSGGSDQQPSLPAAHARLVCR